ncbi:aspartate kinase [bacterium]|nr:aspartate kinase [bacterium]
MIIMKFGGTSIQDVESIQRVAEIIRGRISKRPVVVNSAMGKTTRHLLHTAQAAAQGDSEKADRLLSEVISYHNDLIKSLFPKNNMNPLIRQCDGFFQELVKLKDGVCVLRDLTPRSQDKFLAYGELIATSIIAAVLQQSGLDAVWCDARECMITDDRFTHAQPVREVAFPAIRAMMMSLVSEDRVPVIQGYIGSTREGITTTLGFEGSDFTAALIGAALDAEDIQIWKDVSGVMTADPEIFAEPYTVKQMSFDEAAEITFFGAKVLHPSSIAPAREKNIPVHVLNSKLPECTGTVLSDEAAVCRHPVKSITYKRPVCLLSLRNTHHLPFYDFFKNVFDVLDRERLSPYLANIAERSVKLVLGTSVNLQHLLDDLNPFAKIDIIPHKATVSVIGHALVDHPDIAGRIIHALADIQVELISHGTSNMNTTLVIDADKVETAVSRLHQEFFRQPDPDVFEIQMKKGNVS